MYTATFNNFSAALEFLKEIKVGVVSRSSLGDGFQWSLDDAQLDDRQRLLLQTQQGDDAVWKDEETGMMWIFQTDRLPMGFAYTEDKNFAGHNDWRIPSVGDLKTLRGVFANKDGAYVKPAVPTRLIGAYSCSNAVRKDCHDDGMTWNFSTNSFEEVKYSEGKIQWGAEGQYSGFDKDRTSGEGASIYVRGVRSDRMSEWCESQIRWAEENDYHNFPVTTDTISALQILRFENDNFPPYLSRLQSLSKVEVDRCTTLPPELFLLKNLEELTWHVTFHCDTKPCVMPTGIGDLSSLTSLILEGVDLDMLPQSIGKLVNLKRLHLIRTNISALPDSIGGLINLEELTIAHNALQSLPATIENLANLVSLTVSDRCLTNMPDCFGSLTKLENLVLDWTPILTLPAKIIGLGKLKKLSIKRCSLAALPYQLPEIKSLQMLDISFNRINALPQDIGALRKLETLSIAATLVDELPETLQQLNNLKHLNVSGTPLKIFPDWIGAMANLTNIIAANLWNIGKLPRHEGKKINTYFGMFNNCDERSWLESLRMAGK